MTTPKSKVRIRLESRSDTDKSVQGYEGDLYIKGAHVYVRYEEPLGEQGRTATLIKLERRELRIVRQGDVQAEQTFVAGEKRVGFYQNEHGRMELEMHTHALENALEMGLGTVRWSYDLYVAGEPAGLFRVQLSIEEA
ncbi:DUF1934 domain-containing protein [Paenibacillus athensensis]|uniref:DUF1934 domain-containing protein n=1 Tax=Paenibacillus athensensis TaxID=1967502 RepID=A0A4Y8Q8I5_9BACL|nr:DUF1934 domain-containing protein [Paenibacillus athensensis]MCD1259976.1 DUF1934 domain-containing protein [Paenibacillus athensensis]